MRGRHELLAEQYIEEPVVDDPAEMAAHVVEHQSQRGQTIGVPHQVAPPPVHTGQIRRHHGKHKQTQRTGQRELGYEKHFVVFDDDDGLQFARKYFTVCKASKLTRIPLCLLI